MMRCSFQSAHGCEPVVPSAAGVERAASLLISESTQRTRAAWIADGAVVLPRFQRYEAWGWWQVESLLESVLRRPSLPVGALLMLVLLGMQLDPLILELKSGVYAPEIEAGAELSRGLVHRIADFLKIYFRNHVK